MKYLNMAVSPFSRQLRAPFSTNMPNSLCSMNCINQLGFFSQIQMSRLSLKAKMDLLSNVVNDEGVGYSHACAEIVLCSMKLTHMTVLPTRNGLFPCGYCFGGSIPCKVWKADQMFWTGLLKGND